MEKVLLRRVQEYNPEIIRNIITEDMEEPGSKITITEKSGTGLPTSRMFRRAGYTRLKKQHRIKLLPLEEDKKIRIPLSKGTVHKTITTGRSIADNDFLVYAPKLKSNVLSHGLTAALKLNIGILWKQGQMSGLWPFPLKWISLRAIFKMPKKRVHTFL